LLAQTNSVGHGLGTNWAILQGAEANNTISIPIDHVEWKRVFPAPVSLES
jgi:hypothetical protein